jgi:hypothetical protein
LLYSVAATTTTPPYISPYLIDITSGSNDSDPDDSAITGYDFVTGLGSPRANYLVPALASLPISADFSVSITPASIFLPTLTFDGTGSPSVSWNATYDIAINRFGGFADPVDLSASVSPSSSSASLNQLSGDSYILSFAGSPSGSAQTYSFMVTGTDFGNVLANPTRTAPASLVVNGPPTSMYVARPWGTQGWSVVSGKTLQVQVKLLDNFGHAVPGATVYVIFYLNGSPTRIAGTTADSTGTATFTAVFDSHGVPPGAYSIKVSSVTAPGLTWDGRTPANGYTK